MKWKKRIGWASVAFVLLTACSTEDTTDEGMVTDSDEASEDSGASFDDFENESGVEEIAEEADMEEAPESEESEDGESLIGERVIRTAHLEYETLDFQVTTDHVLDTVQNHGAYVEYSDESSYTPSGMDMGETREDYRRAEYTIRVPVDSLTDFLQDLEGMEGYKISEQIGSEDVTQDYRDTEARIGVLESQENRYTELLEQAESIEDILEIERYLSDTIQEREALQSRLNSYDDLIDFSTVYLTVTERPRISETRTESLSFSERVQEALSNSFYTFYYWLQDLFIAGIYILPYVLVLAVVVLLAWMLKKRYDKKKTKES